MLMEKGILTRNGVIFWDKIMDRKNIKDIYFENQEFKYPIEDPNKVLIDKPITVYFWVETDPIFGFIHKVF